jgi:hypothetical protein
MHNLLQNVQIDVIGALVAAANNTDSNSSRVDMAGYEGCLFLCTCTVFAAGGVATLTIEGGATDADPTATGALTGASATITDTAGAVYNNTILAINVHKPQDRYLQAVRVSSAANVTFGPLIAIRYNGDVLPVTQDTDSIVDSAEVYGV